MEDLDYLGEKCSAAASCSMLSASLVNILLKRLLNMVDNASRSIYCYQEDAQPGEELVAARFRLSASSDQVDRRDMSKADELVKLDSLRTSGALTQKEFDAEKAKLFAGILPALASNESRPSGANASESEGQLPDGNSPGSGKSSTGTNPSIASPSPLADPLVSVPDLFPSHRRSSMCSPKMGGCILAGTNQVFTSKQGLALATTSHSPKMAGKSAWEPRLLTIPSLPSRSPPQLKNTSRNRLIGSDKSVFAHSRLPHPTSNR